ncbi:hypothetical protein CAEBREN_22471 [Caenorhabditis brenneri]|uniref:Uncharacterized protein n=1 Tax=Caenorhabditis brenneri TaxID=135651 RepID=G0M7Z1_CAEBE|nr:hypothetical protein CAEBREN_22471 [Caenorhabditis brenneri]
MTVSNLLDSFFKISSFAFSKNVRNFQSIFGDVLLDYIFGDPVKYTSVSFFSSSYDVSCFRQPTWKGMIPADSPCNKFIVEVSFEHIFSIPVEVLAIS